MASSSRPKKRIGPLRHPFSRSARRLTLTGLILLIAMVVLADRLGLMTPQSPQNRPSDNSNTASGVATATDRRHYDRKIFTVIKVVDGDTVDLDAQDVVGGKAATRIRLWGIDTPETKHPSMGPQYFGAEASAFVRQLVLNQKVTVVLEPYEPSRDKYGRLLAYLYLPDGSMLNEQILAQGFGYADERFKHVYRERFLQLHKQARQQRQGLWKGVQPHQWPQWYRKRHDPSYSNASQSPTKIAG